MHYANLTVGAEHTDPKYNRQHIFPRSAAVLFRVVCGFILCSCEPGRCLVPSWFAFGFLADEFSATWRTYAHERLLFARFASRADLVVTVGLHDEPTRWVSLQLTKLVWWDAKSTWTCNIERNVSLILSRLVPSSNQSDNFRAHQTSPKIKLITSEREARASSLWFTGKI